MTFRHALISNLAICCILLLDVFLSISLTINSRWIVSALLVETLNLAVKSEEKDERARSKNDPDDEQYCNDETTQCPANRWNEVVPIDTITTATSDSKEVVVDPNERKKHASYNPMNTHAIQRAIKSFFDKWRLNRTELPKDWSFHLPAPSNCNTNNNIADVSVARSSADMIAFETRSKKCFARINAERENVKSAIVLNQQQTPESLSSGTADDDETITNYYGEFCRHFDIDGEDCNIFEQDITKIVIDDDVCIVLDVYIYDQDKDKIGGSRKLSYQYELTEPVELELGMTVQHALDFAYMPVLSSTVGTSNDFSHGNTFEQAVVEPKRSNDTEEDTSLVEELSPDMDQWWKWWIPSQWWKKKMKDDQFSDSYRMNKESFAGGSHGEVWRGRRKCSIYEKREPNNVCDERLIFKRLRVEAGYHALEAGLREVYFGSFLASETDVTHSPSKVLNPRNLFTTYVEHFFGRRGELWIVFRDAGPSLRSYLYTATKAGDCVIFQHSWFWTLLRMSVAKKRHTGSKKDRSSVAIVDSTYKARKNSYARDDQKENDQLEGASVVGKELMRSILRQILEAAAFLHSNDIVHRDIKPSNVMCESSFDPEHIESLSIKTPDVRCVLGDFSSAYNDFTRRNLYLNGPSRAEQTDEYAPPEAIFGKTYNKTTSTLTTAFDSWSIGIVALELLLGSPNVFSVDQRTRAVLSHKMQKEGATAEEIEKAMYLAALSQFCIYNPSKGKGVDWPLRDGDPLYNSAMTKQSCTLNDFHRALRARDPLGWGFNNSDDLLHLIWQLLAWNPNERITAAEALRHPYFNKLSVKLGSMPATGLDLESQMLDPRMDFNLTDSVSEFRCPKCGRTFSDWKSCSTHANSRKHAKFCTYEKRGLPTCLHAHSMLPAHSNSGYCDIQGRRPSIEDFHAIHLLPSRQFYGIFDGHLGNLASKYAASFLHKELLSRLDGLLVSDVHNDTWKEQVEHAASASFSAVHNNFLTALALAPYGVMDNSGTTATTAIVTNVSVVITSLGDSRAVISSRRVNGKGIVELSAVQLTKDHQACDPVERQMIESRGGSVIRVNGVDRVNGVLVITRSIGDSNLSHLLSRQPQVLAMTREETNNICGSRDLSTDLHPCFLIVASDGLWDTMSNQEAVDMVAQVISEVTDTQSKLSWRDNAGFQKAAEALTLESYVRGSTDNIGVCIIALD